MKGLPKDTGEVDKHLVLQHRVNTLRTLLEALHARASGSDVVTKFMKPHGRARRLKLEPMLSQ